MSATHPIRLLLIEDSPYDAAIFRQAMEESMLHFTLEHVVRAEEANAFIDGLAERFDIVITDYSLPGMTGIAFCERLLSRYPTMPVILLTGTGSEDIAVRALKTGVSDYLVKDVGNSYLELLPLLIPNAIRRQRERRQRAEFEAELRRSEARYRAIVEDQTDLICRFLPHGSLTFVNQAFCRYFGMARAALIDQSWLRLGAYADDERELAVQLAQTTFDEPLVTLVRVLREGGLERWQRWLVRAIYAADGSLSEYQAVGQDITAQKEYEAALQQKTVDLEARNEELDAFAQTVAHDIKNPISVVIGYAETLLSPGPALDSETMFDTFRMINLCARKTVDIVDELLLLASVRQQDVDLQPTDIGIVARNACERLAHMAGEASASLRIVTTLPPARTYGPWVEEVLVNYVSNAIKYGGKPPDVRIGATLVAGARVRYWVRDNGNGLTREEQERLFQPFNRLAPLEASGHGLGLSIVRRIAARLGGNVFVQSKPGAGCMFFLELPAAVNGVDLPATNGEPIVEYGDLLPTACD